jgi:hypothetical protein
MILFLRSGGLGHSFHVSPETERITVDDSAIVIKL